MQNNIHIVTNLSELINDKSLRAYSCGDSSGITPDSHFNSPKERNPIPANLWIISEKEDVLKKQYGIYIL